MTNFNQSIPPIAFLGFCERAANVNGYQWNILGLKNVIPSFIFPLSLANLYIGLSIFQDTLIDSKGVSLKLVDMDGKEATRINIEAQKIAPTNDEINSFQQVSFSPSQVWNTAFIRLNHPAPVIMKPGNYKIVLEIEGNEINPLGEVSFILINPEPLTDERIAALKSDPSVMKALRYHLQCKNCHDEIVMYAGLEKNEKLELEKGIWYQNLPNTFVCSCGATNVDLTIIKQNLHGLLYIPMGNENISFIPLYEQSGLESVYTTFSQLLDSNPSEEVIQKFIEANPVILHQFSAEKLYFKPSILTQYKADFCILTPHKELLLIEIEKTITRLINKDGGINSELQHALDQVHNWLAVVDEHRGAFLDSSLSIHKDKVSKINAIVIAGRDKNYEPEALKKLKGRDLGRVAFRTYDDILAGFKSLIREIKRL